MKRWTPSSVPVCGDDRQRGGVAHPFGVAGPMWLGAWAAPAGRAPRRLNPMLHALYFDIVPDRDETGHYEGMPMAGLFWIIAVLVSLWLLLTPSSVWLKYKEKMERNEGSITATSTIFIAACCNKPRSGSTLR